MWLSNLHTTYSHLLEAGNYSENPIVLKMFHWPKNPLVQQPILPKTNAYCYEGQLLQKLTMEFLEFSDCRSLVLNGKGGNTYCKQCHHLWLCVLIRSTWLSFVFNMSISLQQKDTKVTKSHKLPQTFFF